jgi:Luciferase-like monooxygenase
MQIGYKLASETFGPAELIRQAVLAEQSGFDFVEMSDHYHPWPEEQRHSAFTWSVLPVIAAKTERIGLATGVTCPSVRYHPAIIAQAAATCGPDADRHLEVARQFADAGFDHLVAMNAGPDRDGFMDFFARELAEPLRALQPGGGGVRDQG